MYREALQRGTGVTGRIACDFWTDLHLADVWAWTAADDHDGDDGDGDGGDGDGDHITGSTYTIRLATSMFASKLPQT